MKKVEIELTDEQEELLLKKIPGKEKEVINTAVEEFFDFLKNPKRFSKFSSFQEFRLFLLIKNVYKEDFISESSIKTIFKINSSPARTMISNVKIDYAEELNEFTKKSMKTFLDNISQTETEGKYTFICKSQSMIDEMNSLLQENDDNARKIVKEKGSLSTYQIYIDEYNLLQKVL
jgi:hypothetical protein